MTGIVNPSTSTADGSRRAATVFKDYKALGIESGRTRKARAEREEAQRRGPNPPLSFLYA
jgi:hypothetical protein